MKRLQMDKNVSQICYNKGVEGRGHFYLPTNSRYLWSVRAPRQGNRQNIDNGFLFGVNMTQQIFLSSGGTFLVSDCDYEELSKSSWSLNQNGYVITNKGRKPFQKKYLVHRLITGAIGDMVVDHINGDKLDNRRENLRICTRAQNTANRGAQINNTTGFKGVRPYRNGYRAEITVQGKWRHIGTYSTAEEAARAYDTVARDLLGEFAHTNFGDVNS